MYERLTEPAAPPRRGAGRSSAPNADSGLCGKSDRLLDRRADERSSTVSAAPSRSAASTSGVKCAAAVMPVISIMQPTMTSIPCARAVAIIRSAAQRSALGQLDVDAIRAPHQSRNIGGNETAFVHHLGGRISPPRAAPHSDPQVGGASGCSRNSTPYSFNTSISLARATSAGIGVTRSVCASFRACAESPRHDRSPVTLRIG